jgi:hypothetical protein
MISLCAGTMQTLWLSYPVPFRSIYLAPFRIFIRRAAAFGTRKPMLITSTKAVILIILTLIILSLVAALIARYPFAAAARSP